MVRLREQAVRAEPAALRKPEPPAWAALVERAGPLASVALAGSLVPAEIRLRVALVESAVRAVTRPAVSMAVAVTVARPAAVVQVPQVEQATC
jgi:hypothetical protein